MKIAFVAPPFGQTGGPEITTTQLVDALVEKGIDVTLFAPADWKTNAKLVPTIQKSLWLIPDFADQEKHERRNLIISSQIKILLKQEEFDLVQLSSQRYAFAIADNLKVPCLLTLNNRVKPRVFELIKKANVHTFAFTEKYKQEIGADYHVKRGIPLAGIKPDFREGSGLITVGRINEQKGIHLAIEIAKKANKKLTIIGRIGNSKDRKEYYDKKIKPYIDGESIIHIEKLENSDVLKLMSQSEALLLPITKPESCPRVQMEALACGTPVIGTRIDPLPELLNDKKIAFLSDDILELVRAASNTHQFDRKMCREFAENNNNILKEAEGYIEIYKKILGLI